MSVPGSARSQPRHDDLPTVRHAAPRLVTVVIPVLNGATTIGAQFDALSRQTYSGDWEIVVADNGSTDATATICAEWAPRFADLRVVDASDRSGPSHARNVGACAARGDLLAFCDADDVVNDRWLEALVAVALDHDLVGGLLRADELNDRRVQASRGSRSRTTLGQSLSFLQFAPSGNLAVWRATFETIGGLDTTYRQGEDVEFSWRAQLGGYRLGTASGAVVQYRYRSSMKSTARQAFGTGVASVRLFRSFRASGAQRPAPRVVARRWLAMLARLPLLALPSQRLTSIRLLSGNLGKLVASVRYRVVFL
jgi:glycosyltransferase involved in cell wall biosynthesis